MSPRRLAPLLLAAAWALTGCQQTPATPGQQVSAAPVELKVTIAGGRVDPSGAQLDVARGATVHVTVTSDSPDTLHVHGFDREVEVGPGRPADFTFVADKVGRYEVETHNPARVVARLNVR